MRFFFTIFVMMSAMVIMAMSVPLDLGLSKQVATKDTKIVGTGNQANTGIDVSQVQADLTGKVAALTGGSSDVTGIVSKTLGGLVPL